MNVSHMILYSECVSLLCWEEKKFIFILDVFLKILIVIYFENLK
jgi:hypothetical protein